MPDTASEMATVAAELSAVQSEASLTSTPEATTVSPEAASGAIPASETPNPLPEGAQPEKPKGPIPFDRHEAILKGTREEYEQKLAAYQWAKDLDADTVRRQRELYEWADTDPLGYYEFFGRQLRNDPRFADKFQPAQKEEADAKPAPDVLLEDGRIVYSAEQTEKLIEWRERQSEARRTKAEQDAARVQNESRTEAQSLLADARTWPGFEESTKEIRELMMADKRVTLESAYRRIVIPKLEAAKNDAKARAREEVLLELKTKTTAGTTNPGAAVVVPPKSFKGMSTEDIMREIYAEQSR